MKKLFILILVAGIAWSCGTPKTVLASKKVITGNWNLETITYNTSGTFNVKLLSDTSKECFEGSTWKFVGNNNEGIYTINNSDCPTGDRYFNFTIQEVNPEDGLFDFLLKPTDAKHKTPDGIGYRLRLARLGDSSMRWEQSITLDGEPFIISMNFTKI